MHLVIKVMYVYADSPGKFYEFIVAIKMLTSPGMWQISTEKIMCRFGSRREDPSFSLKSPDFVPVAP